MMTEIGVSIPDMQLQVMITNFVSQTDDQTIINTLSTAQQQIQWVLNGNNCKSEEMIEQSL